MPPELRDLATCDAALPPSGTDACVRLFFVEPREGVCEGLSKDAVSEPETGAPLAASEARSWRSVERKASDGRGLREEEARIPSSLAGAFGLVFVRSCFFSSSRLRCGEDVLEACPEAVFLMDDCNQQSALPSHTLAGRLLRDCETSRARR